MMEVLIMYGLPTIGVIAGAFFGYLAKKPSQESEIRSTYDSILKNFQNILEERNQYIKVIEHAEAACREQIEKLREEREKDHLLIVELREEVSALKMRISELEKK